MFTVFPEAVVTMIPSLYGRLRLSNQNFILNIVTSGYKNIKVTESVC